MAQNEKIWLGLPKGSLQESSLALLGRAGWTFAVSSRSYYPTCDDESLAAMLIRPQEMGRYIERGALDVGLTGLDWIREVDADVEIVAELVYAKATRNKVRWVLAVPEASDMQSVKDLEGKTISTEVVALTCKYLNQHGVEATVEFSHGATEVKVPHLADAIVDITETGSSLKANRLRIIDTVAESTTVLAANRRAMNEPWKREKIMALAIMLNAALTAQQKVLLKLNVAKTNLPAVLNCLPAMHSPTVNNLSDSEWVAVETVLDSQVIRDLVPKIISRGASGIIEIPLNKVIP